MGGPFSVLMSALPVEAGGHDGKGSISPLFSGSHKKPGQIYFPVIFNAECKGDDLD